MSDKKWPAAADELQQKLLERHFRSSTSAAPSAGIFFVTFTLSIVQFAAFSIIFRFYWNFNKKIISFSILLFFLLLGRVLFAPIKPPLHIISSSTSVSAGLCGVGFNSPVAWLSANDFVVWICEGRPQFRSLIVSTPLSPHSTASVLLLILVLLQFAFIKNWYF